MSKEQFDPYNKIAEYLSDALIGEEQALFDKALATDPSLVKAVEESKKVIDVVLSYDERTTQKAKDLYDDLSEEGFYDKLDNNLEKARSIRVIKPYRTYRLLTLAATVALLIGFGWWWLKQSNSLFDQHFNVYAQDHLSAPVTKLLEEHEGGFAGGRILKLLQDAMVAYNAGDYERAITLFEEYDPRFRNNAIALFYMGNSYLGVEDLENGRLAFEDLRNKEGTLEGHDFELWSLWYLSLIAIKSDDHQLSSSYLEALSKKENFPYHENVLILLLELKQDE